MAQKTINFGGMTVDQVYSEITKVGVTEADAKIIAASWIFENLGRTQRVFGYAENFPATDAACQVAPFVRQFVHADWVDGEDVVQAGVTPGEDGLNQRFHRIETDLDALGARVATLSACLAAMRASLRKLLDELRTEINRINTDVYNCCNKGQTIGPVATLPNYVPGLIEPGTYMGSTKFFDQNISIWQTKQGTIVLPAIETLGVEAVAGGRVRTAGYLAKYVADKPEVRQRFPNEFAVKDLVAAFGDDRLDDGRTVFEATKILSQDAKFAGLDAMVDEISAREAATLRTLAGSQAAITVALGIDERRETTSDAKVDGLSSLPLDARNALIRKGIGTVGKLAGMAPRELSTIMRDAGIKIGAGDAAAWITDAKTLTRLEG